MFSVITWYANYRFGNDFNKIIKDTTLINESISLATLFNHIYNAYSVEYKEKGFVGVWKFRKNVLSQINNLNLGMFHQRNKTLSETNLKESLSHLQMYKDLLLHIKFTIEVITFIRKLFGFITKAAFIPVFVLSLYYFIRRVVLLWSFIFTSSYASFYLNSYYDFNSKLSSIKNSIKDISIKFHNWLFDDNLVSAGALNVQIPSMDKYFNIIPTPPATKWYNFIDYSSYLPNVDLSLAGYAVGAFVVLSTAWLIYTGTIEPVSLIGKIGGFLSLFFTTTVSDGDDDSGPSAPTNRDDHSRPYRNLGVSNIEMEDRSSRYNANSAPESTETNEWSEASSSKRNYAERPFAAAHHPSLDSKYDRHLNDGSVEAEEYKNQFRSPDRSPSPNGSDDSNRTTKQEDINSRTSVSTSTPRV